MEYTKSPKWQRIRFMPNIPLGKDGQRVTACPEHIALAREAATEGMVLLKNDGTLPLKKGQKLAVFGKAQADYVKGGGGSGTTYPPYEVSILKGLQNREQEGTLELYAPLSKFYQENVDEQYAQAILPGFTTEPELPEYLLKGAREFTDMAVMTVCRFSKESWDRTGAPFDGDFYLSKGEDALLRQILATFNKVVVILNSGGMMDTMWFKDEPKICSALLAWQPGMEGGNAVADILFGDVCPSGRLTDTFAVDFDAYPSSATYNESDMFVEYQEDIYVGYRYFETIPGVAEKVCYPFGFGLSYTTFAISDTAFADEGDSLIFTAKVKNTGSVAGKQVVQLYCKAPQGKLGKAARVLVGFRKTKTLAPGEEQTVTIGVPLDAMASFDDEGLVAANAWVLEQGLYEFYMGENVRAAKILPDTYLVPEDRILEQLTAKCVPQNLTRRMRADGTYQELGQEKDSRARWQYDGVQPVTGQDLPRECRWPVEHKVREKILPPWPAYAKNGERSQIQLIDVYKGNATLDELLDEMSDEQMIHLLGGQPNRGPCNTFGFGNLDNFGIPNAMTADGPAGLRLRPETGVKTTCFPCANLTACTWNPEILYRIGRAGAAEVKENGCGIWLTPAVNIHRSPLCGRNYEYYSEDPLLAGAMASAMVAGIQSMGIAASLKHFACNNKENNRRDCNSVLSQRALREIYLKAFEICVKEAQPWTIMSSYNLVNGKNSSENRELLTDILRGEWGFEGAVTTDWYTLVHQYKEIAAGNDIKMACGMPDHTYQMLQEGKISREDIRLSAKRVLELILKLD